MILFSAEAIPRIKYFNQKKLGSDDHRLKTMVKRSIEQNFHELRDLRQETEIMKEMPLSRIRGQNSVDNEFLEIVGNGSPTGSVRKETIALSATIWISVEKVHHQIRLRILSCGRMSENHREPEVPEEEVPVVARGGISMPNFEVLDATIASALNKIIHNSHFKRRISLEEQMAQKQDSFLRDRQITYLIYDYFRVIGIHDSVENYADLRNDDIQEFETKLDGILLSMTKITPDDNLEGLYKLRIRESEKLKTVLELYDLETHQKKLGPDYHRLKTMGKRSIEQDIRNKNFGSRNGNLEKNVAVKNQGIKQCGQRVLGDCWQWEFNGQCSWGDNCSFHHDINKRGKLTQPNPHPSSFIRQNERNASKTWRPRGKKSPSGRMSRWICKDYFRGTCNNSFCEKWHPPECLFYKSESGFQFAEKC